MELAHGAIGEFRGLAQQLVAVAGDGEGIGARPRLIGEPRGPVGREAYFQARGAEWLGRRDFRQPGERLAERAVGAEAEAPHAIACPALESRVLHGAERERDVERRIGRPGRELISEQHRIGGRGAEEPPVERVIDAPGERRGAGRRAARFDQAHIGELGGGELGERLHYPARLQRRIGKDADAQFLPLGARGERELLLHG